MQSPQENTPAKMLPATDPSVNATPSDGVAAKGVWVIEKRDGRMYSGPRNPDGSVPREAALKLPVIQRVVSSNKMLLRGLSFMMYGMWYRISSSYVAPSVSEGTSTNPFGAVIFTRSQIRPDWFESNTSNNANCTPNPGETGTGTPNFGTRGVAINDNTGTLRMTDQSPVGAAPYDTVEYTIYAQDNPSAAVETGNKGIDNFDINCIGMAQGLDAGDGGTQSRWGTRTVLGQKPQAQGVTDRVSVGEPSVGGGVDPLPANGGTAINSYVASNQGAETGSYEGHNGFDGDTSAEYNYTTPGSWLGGSWRSATGSSHFLGRVWTATKQVSGFRIVLPQGIPYDNVLSLFRCERLTGADPTNPSHWTPEAEHDYTSTTQTAVLYAAGPWGVEYMFTSPLAASNGFRIASMTAEVSGNWVELAELMIFEEMPAKTLDATQNKLSLSTDGGANFGDYTTGSVAATQDVQDLVDAINGGVGGTAGVLGHELEARRTPFGYLIVQGSTQGLNSLMDLQTVANTAHTELGLTLGAYAGSNVTVTKGQNDIVTFTYRLTVGLDEGTNA
jgi:hypothetical protein